MFNDLVISEWLDANRPQVEDRPVVQIEAPTYQPAERLPEAPSDRGVFIFEF